MSWMAFTLLHPATLSSMDLQGHNPETGWACGCRSRGPHVNLCSYHVAFDDGAEAADLLRGVGRG